MLSIGVEPQPERGIEARRINVRRRYSPGFGLASLTVLFICSGALITSYLRIFI